MIHYRVSYQNPLTLYLQIEPTLDVAADAAGPLELQLPAWRPGRYELQNFAQKIQRVVVEDAAIGPSPSPTAKSRKTAGKWPLRPAAPCGCATISTPTRWMPAAPGWMKTNST